MMLVTPRPQHPRWVNLDNKYVMDTVTGQKVRLSCLPEWSDDRCNQHAMKVTDALNRIYHGTA